MTLAEAIRAAGVTKAFRRPVHAIPSYYNGHVKDFYNRTHLSMLSLEDIEAEDWLLCDEPLFTQSVGRGLRVPNDTARIRRKSKSQFEAEYLNRPQSEPEITTILDDPLKPK